MNTTKLKLTNPSDDELEAAIAEYVCGCTGVCDGMMRLPDTKMGGSVFEAWKRIPDFATSADAVLPLLERHRYITNATYVPTKQEWCVGIGGDSGSAPTFPRAACIALLRANGIEVEITATRT